MIPAARLGLRLALGSARHQRLRAASVLVAVFVGAVVLLSISAIAHSQQVQQPEVYADVDNQRLLAAVIASILLPVLVLVATVGRLSAGLRDRRMANLRLLGMGRSAVRLVAAVETGVAALAGALLAILGFLVVRRPLSHVRVAGHGWPLDTLWPPAWTYVAVVLMLPAVVMLVGAVPVRLRIADALARARRADARRPGWWRVAPLALGVMLCGILTGAGQIHPELVRGIEIPVLFAGVALLAIGLILVVPVFVRLLADGALRLTGRPALTIAARRLQAQPAGVSRVVSGLLIGLFVVVGARSVVVAFESVSQYQIAADQIRDGQYVPLWVTAGQADRQVRIAQDQPDVRDVFVLTRLQTSCRGTDPCLQAVVATCSQLRTIISSFTGCVPGRTTVVDRWLTQGVGPLRLSATHQFQPLKGSPTVAIPRPVLDTRAGTGDVNDVLADELGVDLVVPPDLPGVQELTARSDKLVLVTGGPGRHLADRLSSHGALVSSSPDFAYYDFVAQLRAMVWAIASVILSLGLLAFAVAAVDRAVTRRPEMTALQLVGAPRSVLRRAQWLEAAAPLALGCALAIGLGLLAGAAYLTIGGPSTSPAPWAQALLLAGLAALGSALVGGMTVLACSPRISPDLIRRE